MFDLSAELGSVRALIRTYYSELSDMHTVAREAEEVDKKLNDDLQRYAEMLGEAQLETDEQRTFRLTWPKRFLQFCKFHLCVLIDVPVDFFNEYQVAYGESDVDVLKHHKSMRSVKSVVFSASQGKRQEMKPWKRIQNSAFAGTLAWSPSCVQPRKEQNGATWQNIKTLMNLIDTEEYLRTEGIFRKSGNAVRLRLIRQRLCDEKPLDLTNLQATEPRAWGPAGQQSDVKAEPGQMVHPSIGVHDLASALKGALSDLKEPVLTKLLIPLFREVAGLTLGNLNDEGQRVQLRPIEQRIAEGKQLKALRLLCLLMPQKHRELFQCLLRLLQNILQYTDTNRLSADTLGTLFGPVLLSPNEAPAKEMHSQYRQLANLTTIMINEGVEGLWKVPSGFAEDINQCFSSLRSAPRQQPLDLDDQDSTLIITRSQEPVVEKISMDSGTIGIDGSQNGDMDDAPPRKKVFRKVMAQIVSFNLTPMAVTRKTKCKSLHVESDDNLDGEDAALITCLRFAVEDNRADSDVEAMDQATHSETKSALNDLYLTIQALPDNDPKKSRLLKRFNKTNDDHTQCTKDTGKLSQTPLKKVSSRNGRVNTMVWSPTQSNSPTYSSHIRRANVTPNTDMVFDPRASLLSRAGEDRLLCCPLSLGALFKRRDNAMGTTEPAATLKRTAVTKTKPVLYETENYQFPELDKTRSNPVLNREESESPTTYYPIVMTDQCRGYQFQELVKTRSNPALNSEESGSAITDYPAVITDMFPRVGRLMNNLQPDHPNKSQGLDGFGYGRSNCGTKRLSVGVNLPGKPCLGMLRRVRTVPNFSTEITQPLPMLVFEDIRHSNLE